MASGDCWPNMTGCTRTAREAERKNYTGEILLYSKLLGSGFRKFFSLLRSVGEL